jgi:hypothetical protein
MMGFYDFVFFFFLPVGGPAAGKGRGGVLAS